LAIGGIALKIPGGKFVGVAVGEDEAADALRVTGDKDL